MRIITLDLAHFDWRATRKFFCSNYWRPNRRHDFPEDSYSRGPAIGQGFASQEGLLKNELGSARIWSTFGDDGAIGENPGPPLS